MLPLLAVTGAFLSAPGDWFPFALPQLEAEPGITNLSEWNERPAGAKGPIRVRDGHLVDGAGQRVRFFATNLCFAACYPSHESAEKLAARLARLGVNLVRLHHTDTQPFPRGIWDPEDQTRHTLHPEALDRLDYLVAQLISQGIYVNVNLHVGRTPTEADPAPEPARLPNYGKGVDNFWPPLIEVQKWYARALLDRENKYTGRKYTQEPGVAFIEISNEDSLISLLRGSWGGLDSLPKPYQDFLDERWEETLRQRYGSTEKLRAAWSEGEVPLGEELAANGDFHAGLEGWGVEPHAPCEMVSQLTQDGPEGRPALRITVTQTDEVGWHGQTHYKPFALRAGQPYTVTLWLRADPARTVSLNTMMSHEPWSRLGLGVTLPVGPEWRQYRLPFRAVADEDAARVTVSNLALSQGTVWVSGVSVREGGVLGLPEGQSLEDGTVRRLAMSELGGRTPAAARDQSLFYLDLERSYWQQMYDYLKQDLGAQNLVTGTQITYSPYYTQDMMDYVDAHSYWQHPAFPGRPWDPRNWYVRNISMVANPPGTLGRLIAHRIEGKPFTVSEYNHPAPNQYGGEALILLSAYAAFQDWDAVYSFSFSNQDEWELDRVGGYFDVKSHPAQLVSFPAAAALIRRPDLAPGKELTSPAADLDTALHLMREGRNSVSALDVGVAEGDLLRHRVALRWGGQPTARVTEAAAENRTFLADTEELVWDATQPGAEVVLLRAPRAKGVVGFCCGRELDLGGDVRINVGPNSLNWAAVTLTQLEGQAVGGAGDLLVTAAGAYRNPDWGWQDLGNERVTLGPNWGRGPVEVEGISARILLPVPADRVQAWALDERGQPKQSLEVQPAGEGSAIELSPRYATLWYHIRVGAG